ncbi:uncharacterized protein LOC133359662 isoform X1 [Lethenteron reissneri]|uniref:uncharacterized protein LOC133359662 isoform X1 n=1 Tax=Lethenteron reissneri TaxID=7753 RepID=UPI002AB7DA2B|nr:uncharacterized protein LOC133359662 isoform X1 [Lethenteron reissneri]
MSPFRLLTTLLTFTLMLMAPLSAEGNQGGCPPGRYRTETNFCCKLCPSGTSKDEDCRSDGEFPVCMSCANGDSFTASANNLSSCNACKVCEEQNEILEHPCTTIHDTVCTCPEGLQRASQSLLCEEIKGSRGWIVALVIVMIATLCGFAGLVYWIKRSKMRPHAAGATDVELQPLQEENHPEPPTEEPQVEVVVVRNAVEMIQEKMASSGGAVWTWLSDRRSELLECGGGGVGPHLLLDLFLRELIDEAESWKARGLPDASRRAHYVIALVVDRGEEACGKFRDIYEDFSSRKRTFLDMQSQADICSPTFDPNTANEMLLLSTDLKTVTRATHAHPYPKHGDRFVSHPQVLCSDKFLSSLHYWELHVGCAEQYMVGVVGGKDFFKTQESVKDLGHSAASWCVWRRDAELVAAHDGEVTVLNPPVPPQRIGLHLDCDNLKLMFVCAETMTPLHTFTLKWVRRLELTYKLPFYPAMWLHSGSITIAQPLTREKSPKPLSGSKAERYQMAPLLSRRPYLFLHEMLMQGHIKEHVYWTAYTHKKDPYKCQDFIESEVKNEHKAEELNMMVKAFKENETGFLSMLQSSERCSPTVNPNSVNSDLRLSVDLRTVTLSSERHSYPHHPERFENSAQALCREGFSSGAHYWEVDVGGAEQFRVGVACATLPRGGSAEAQLLGAGADSWCLWRREGGYAASHCGCHTALAAVRPPPRKIGVHLCWEKGLLSFYCADTRRRLHSFNATAFPSHLYPALCVHKGTVTILRLSLRVEEDEGVTGEVGKSNDEERAEENGRQSKAGVASDVGEGGGVKSEVGDSGAGKSEGWESARVNPDPEAQDGGAVVNAAGESGDATKEDVETFTDNVKSKVIKKNLVGKLLSKAGIKSDEHSTKAMKSDVGEDERVKESEGEKSDVSRSGVVEIEVEGGGAVESTDRESGDAKKGAAATLKDNVKSKDKKNLVGKVLSKAGIKSYVRSGEAVEAEVAQGARVKERGGQKSGGEKSTVVKSEEGKVDGCKSEGETSDVSKSGVVKNEVGAGGALEFTAGESGDTVKGAEGSVKHIMKE